MVTSEESISTHSVFSVSDYQLPTQKILDFDMESVAAGFADPNWVPQKISCIAWSWVGSEDVFVLTCGDSRGFYERSYKRKEMLINFLPQFLEADVVRGHNLIRHDLPLLNTECMRLGLDILPPKRVHDSMRIIKTKGFKKGQDNLCALLNTYEQKLSLNWQEWDDAYCEEGWPTVKRRAKSDVLAHKELYTKMEERGWLKAPTMWRP